MTGLVLKLSPRERVLINGVVIENCDRRTRISILSPNARILRLRDAIHPQDANTPVARVCYICQLLVTGDADQDEGRAQALTGIGQLREALADRQSREILDRAADCVSRGNPYHALKWLRRILPLESRLLAEGRG